MYHFLSASVLYAFLIVVLARDPMKKFLRDGAEPIGKRDYTPSKWITNSAMDVWYGNKSMIDIMWREFSDVMYKLTDRRFRSPQLEDFKPNKTDDNMTMAQDIKIYFNNSNTDNKNISIVNLFNNFVNNVSLFNNAINNVSLFNNYINNETLNKDDVSNISLYNNEANVSLFYDDDSNVSLFYDYIIDDVSLNNETEALSLIEPIIMFDSLNITIP